MYSGFSLKKGNKSIARIIDPKIKDDKKKDADAKFIDLVTSDIKDELQTEIVCEEGFKLEPLMVRQGDDKLNNRVYIAGASLSGKSFMATLLAQDYNRQFKKNKVSLFSYVDEDKNLNDKKIKRFQHVQIDEEILQDPLELDECADRLCIFDDIEAYSDRHVVQSLRDFSTKIVNTGRHHNTDVIITSQQLLKGHQSRDVLNGIFQLISFPQTSTRYALFQYLKRYMFLPKNLIDKVLNVRSRWVLLNLSNPQYVLHENGAFLLNCK